LSDPDYEILAFEARANEADDIQVLLPPIDDIDAVLGTEKWLVRQAESEALGLNEATQVEMVGVNGRSLAEEEAQGGSACASAACGDKRLEW
jgi:nitrite reductase (NAD(P)H)